MRRVNDNWLSQNQGNFFHSASSERDTFCEQDPVSPLLHWTSTTLRRKYSVPGPNALWLIEGLHKQVQWEFVVYRCINGY